MNCESKHCAAIALVVLMAAGCQDSGYNVAHVSGRVTLDGAPLTGAKVMFAPMAAEGGLKAGKAGLGVLDDAGEFVIGTYGSRDGAVVARHRVTLINRSSDSTTGPRMARKRLLLPDVYDVVAGEDNAFEIAITSEMVARYGRN
ncbi:MAG: hypothetical protein AAF916_11780 [Planctomycetota bacterium]